MQGAEPDRVQPLRSFVRMTFIPPPKLPALRKSFLLTACLSLLLIGSCNRSPSGDQRDHSTIKIGYYGDLSGPTFNFGESAKNGVLMAAEEINQAGGINGRRVDIVIEDHPRPAALAPTPATKLIHAATLTALTPPRPSPTRPA